MIGLPGSAAATVGPSWVPQESGTTATLHAVQSLAGSPGDAQIAGTAPWCRVWR